MSNKVIFDKKNILIIGGAGFIGSHLCDELIKDNKVICLDNFSTGAEANIDHLLANPDFVFIKHDVSEQIDLENLKELQRFKIQFQGIQEIYYLACPTSPKKFEENKIANLLANSLGLKNALDIVMRNESKFIYFSSSVVYGGREETGEKKVAEDYIGKTDFLSERSSYDEGKRFGETMVKNYKDVYGLDVKIIRPFRIFGPRMKLNDNQMIPDFIDNALDNKDLAVYGDENFSSSFCYVSDLIDATLKMMETEVSGPINIGSDLLISLKRVAQKIIDIVESNSNIVYKEEKTFMTQLALPDISKASNELGWMPVVTFDKGIERTIDDLRAKKGLKTVI
ncbi:NAD-dependent epimerase/dehydratase family protein [bacterium]|nr:NAD-dependent epimerase/dehydratase family protein [bacterium]